MLKYIKKTGANLLLKQFKSFYYRNYPNDMESFVELFAVFGGLDIDIDTSLPLELLIKEHILKNFTDISLYIDELLLFDTDSKKLLGALAVSDRRIFSAFKRAKLNNTRGGIALNFLQQRNLIKIEYSREEDKRKTKPKLSKEEARHRISDKFLFMYPFLRFWFYFIYPHQKEIKNNNFKNVLDDFKTRRNSFVSLMFEELSQIVLNYHLRDEIIETNGSYWDANIEIDIMTITKKGNVFIAECKWTNHKVNKKELNKIYEKCEQIGINPKQIILFSKRGFSKELLAMQNSKLALYSVEDFSSLVKSSPEIFCFPLSF